MVVVPRELDLLVADLRQRGERPRHVRRDLAARPCTAPFRCASEFGRRKGDGGEVRELPASPLLARVAPTRQRRDAERREKAASILHVLFDSRVVTPRNMAGRSGRGNGGPASRAPTTSYSRRACEQPDSRLALLLAGATPFAAQTATESSIIPRPASVSVGRGTFQMSARTALSADREDSAVARRFARDLAPATGFDLRVRFASVGERKPDRLLGAPRDTRSAPRAIDSS